MDGTLTIHWKAVEQYLTVVLFLLFVIQFYPVGNFGEFIGLGLGTVRSVRIKQNILLTQDHCSMAFA